MLKKLLLGILALIVLAAIFIGWRYFTSNTAFSEKSKYLYIHTGHATYPEVLKTIEDSNLVKSPGAFDFLAKRMDLPEKVKAGRYEIQKGMSLADIVRLLRNGHQSPVKLIITKLRTKEDLAELIGKKMECDSTSVIQYMNNVDSVKQYGVDTSTFMTVIYPNTYIYFWNSTPAQVFEKLAAEHKKIWTPERVQQAQQHGLTPTTAYILASIVEEETNAKDEKGTMASVYLNRVNKHMPLQADPTIKFAMRNFGLKRIYLKYLAVESPYNTYRNTGLPPGPICTPSLQTLDAVLQSPQTDYLYFVAKSDFSGRHVFSATYEEHLKHRKEFQQAQDAEEQKRNAAREDLGSQK
jgi:UPF0755 protein